MMRKEDESSELDATTEHRHRGSTDTADALMRGNRKIRTSEHQNEEDDLENAPAFTAQDELNDIASLSPADVIAVEADLHGLTANIAGLACTISTSNSMKGDADFDEANSASPTGRSSAGSARAQAQHQHQTPISPTAALSRFDEEMAKLPSSQTAAYHQAEAKCSDLVNDERRMAFLECENYDTKLAAERLARCWETRLELFGPDRCFLPMTLDGAMKNEASKMLHRRIYQPLPVTDTAGRALIFVDPSRRNFAEYSMEQECMVVWYLLETAMEDPDVRRSGVVFISDARGMQRKSYSRKLSLLATVCFSVQPIRMRAFHFCCPSRMANYLIEPVVRYTLSRDMRLRVKKHNGSVESVRQILEGYCLPRDRLPTELGGDVVLDMKKWILERWALEISKASASHAPTANQPKSQNSKGSAKDNPRRWGNQSDPRMARALKARIANPDIPLHDALVAGGYSFSYNSERNTIVDADGISLQQRKNNLCRRIRNEKRKREGQKIDNSTSVSSV